MTALWIFLLLSLGYFSGQWNWNIYYDNKPNRLKTLLKTLLFPISTTRCEKGPALITLFKSRRFYSIVMAFLWPIKLIILCCEWVVMVLANAI